MNNMITSTDYSGETCKLVLDKTGATIHEGDKLPDFRGDIVTINGGRAPHKASSSGQVFTSAGAFYPSVVGCSWVPLVKELPARERPKATEPKDLPALTVACLKPSYVKASRNPNLGTEPVRVIDVKDGVAFIESGNTLWRVPESAFRKS